MFGTGRVCVGSSLVEKLEKNLAGFK